jgi:hypothetical protein
MITMISQLCKDYYWISHVFRYFVHFNLFISTDNHESSHTTALHCERLNELLCLQGVSSKCRHSNKHEQAIGIS